MKTKDIKMANELKAWLLMGLAIVLAVMWSACNTGCVTGKPMTETIDGFERTYTTKWFCGIPYKTLVEDHKTPEQIAEDIEVQKMKDKAKEDAALRKSGYRQMKYGAIALAMGVLGAVVLAHYGLELIAVVVALLGVVFIISGALTTKIADNVTAIAYGALSALVIGVIWLFTRGKGLKFTELKAKLFKKKDKE